ncbi:hypothetical protein N7462_009499 [Penicillium macrosclerotiorum]|uniref:uncharacterized protein n=1 Tax=Penicillium macrosclerotiorum TaxID=303699 RepID=UPI0025487825|nr:uncharacterized protein N7462_009499 [Penicillium macrosclerotiorum]KAJ5674060.1 hypothetical protein N7462_009499 [Penicillium macrosclerotiorum]
MTEISTKAEHLCVLVHGLWGNPKNLEYLEFALRQKHSEEILYILRAKDNSGSFTYDGIELGGERVAHEIEQTLMTLEAKGQKITKISIVGYSLGGLVSRYAIGLLHSRGWFEKVQPINFTTFASPHVGARIHLKGLWNYIWNTMGAITISMSGRQLFMIDSFRDTGRPLLNVLADHESIFIQGLKKFHNRCVYANIVHDRTVKFYTSAISKTDPFGNLENININYVNGYHQVIIDSNKWLLPFMPKKETMWTKTKSFTRNLPYNVLVFLLAPILVPLYLLNAVIQTPRSRQRIRQHEEGDNGLLFGRYKIPLLVQDAQNVLEELFDTANVYPRPDYLSTIEEVEMSDSSTLHAASLTDKKLDEVNESMARSDLSASTDYIDIDIENSGGCRPTLDLTDEQFSIIDSLNAVGFRKHPVHIHHHRRGHAAMIVRRESHGFEEGKMVLKHWLDNEFVI